MVVVNQPGATDSSFTGPSHTVVAIGVSASIVALVAIVLGSILVIRRQRRAGRIELPPSPSSDKSHWSADALGSVLSPRSVAQLGVPSILDADTVVGASFRHSSATWSITDCDTANEPTKLAPPAPTARSLSFPASVRSRFSFEP